LLLGKYIISSLIILVFIFSACKTSRKVAEDKDDPKASEVVPVPDIYDELPRPVPAYPDTIYYELPDNYILKIFLRGDEHHHIALTVDGYRLLMNDDGFYEYAVLSHEGKPVPSGIIARNPGDRTDKDWEFLNYLIKNN